MKHTGVIGLVALTLSPFFVACAPESSETEDGVEETKGAVVAENALSANALSANALSANALSANALSANALSANSLTLSELSDSRARELLKYIISCALPASAQIDLTIEGQSYTFDGQIGLAPSWGEEGGSCDSTCQTWISGCVISRLNKLGESVPISMRGDHCALDITTAEQTEYDFLDGAYYGDIFSTPKLLYACLPPSSTSLTRVCGDSLEDCAVKVVGWCDHTCDKINHDGSYPKCRDRNKKGHGTTVFPGSVTIYLRGHE